MVFPKTGIEFIDAYGAVLLAGLGLTLQLLFVSAIGGFLLALPIGIALTAKRRRVRWLAALFTLTLRGSPLFVQLFLIYYGLPQILIAAYGGILAVKASFWWPLVSSPFLLISLAFVLNLAAYMAEDIRVGLDTVPKGQREAAASLGLRPTLVMIHILMPTALRTMMPTLFNQVILTLKSTTLASTITLRDLLGAGSMIFSRTYDVSIYLVLAVFYLMLAAGLSAIFRSIENHTLTARRIDRQTKSESGRLASLP